MPPATAWSRSPQSRHLLRDASFPPVSWSPLAHLGRAQREQPHPSRMAPPRPRPPRLDPTTVTVPFKPGTTSTTPLTSPSSPRSVCAGVGGRQTRLLPPGVPPGKRFKLFVHAQAGRPHHPLRGVGTTPARLTRYLNTPPTGRVPRARRTQTPSSPSTVDLYTPALIGGAHLLPDRQPEPTW